MCIPIRAVELVPVVRRDERLHPVLANRHQRLVEEVDRLPVVLAERRLKGGHLGDADAALCARAAAGLAVDPDAEDLDAGLGERGEVSVLVGVGQALDEVVAGAGPRVRRGALGEGGGGGANGEGEEGDERGLHDCGCPVS